MQCLPLFACQVHGIDRRDGLTSKRLRLVEVSSDGDDAFNRGSNGGLNRGDMAGAQRVRKIDDGHSDAHLAQVPRSPLPPA